MNSLSDQLEIWFGTEALGQQFMGQHATPALYPCMP